MNFSSLKIFESYYLRAWLNWFGMLTEIRWHYYCYMLASRVTHRFYFRLNTNSHINTKKQYIRLSKWNQSIFSSTIDFDLLSMKKYRFTRDVSTFCKALFDTRFDTRYTVFTIGTIHGTRFLRKPYPCSITVGRSRESYS